MKEQKIKNPDFKCSICGYEWTLRYSYRAPEDTFNRFSCPKCPYIFPTKEEVETEKRR